MRESGSCVIRGGRDVTGRRNVIETPQRVGCGCWCGCGCAHEKKMRRWRTKRKCNIVRALFFVCGWPRGKKRARPPPCVWAVCCIYVDVVFFSSFFCSFVGRGFGNLCLFFCFGVGFVDLFVFCAVRSILYINRGWGGGGVRLGGGGGGGRVLICVKRRENPPPPPPLLFLDCDSSGECWVHVVWSTNECVLIMIPGW